MNYLADLVKERAKDLDIQIAKSKYLTPSEAEWVKHKQIVNSLSADYNGILRDKVKNEFFNVEKKEYDKNFALTIQMPEYSEKFKTFLEIVENKEKGIHCVTYFAYNKDKNTYFVREIFGRKFK